MTKHVAIVGGGFFGAQLASALDDSVYLTLIEQNSHFVNAPAMIRALVQPQWLDQALVPYTHLLQRGRVIQARAQSVDAKGVDLCDGRRVSADYIVVATGSSNGCVFKPGIDGIEGLRRENARVHSQLVAAQHVVIVGAGAVGVELAGELAHFMPEKFVTLVSPDATLFPKMPAALGRRLLAHLRALGVNVLLGVRAENLEHLSEPYKGNIRISTGRVLPADLIVPTLGSRPNTSLLEKLPGALIGRNGRIEADNWMRPSTLPNVFAAGDAVDFGDPMTIVAQMSQLRWLKKTLRCLLKGNAIHDLPYYVASDASRRPFLVPLGPQLGASSFGYFTVGSFLTRSIKGRNLFVNKYRKMFNVDRG